MSQTQQGRSVNFHIFHIYYISTLIVFFLGMQFTFAQSNHTKLVEVDSAWAKNSVNAVIFRKNSLVTFNGSQYIAFYDKDRYVVLGKRRTGDTKWELRKTVYQGNTGDAHNTISIMVDGKGYLHLAWDHHNNSLRYCKSVAPGSLEMSEKMPMVGELEQRVSYPEFFRLPGGDLLFFYRDGGSGQGNLVLNRYDIRTGKWSRLHNNLIDGEGERSAYWQVFVDTKDNIHISWVWRETPDVASNHDMCYARSSDGGKTWTSSGNKPYRIPIKAADAEYACRIPQNSELINQTSMFVDESGIPYIATYWREANDSIPQYHLIYKKGKQWQTSNLKFRKTPFSLKGEGTRRIPVSRPQIIAWKSGSMLRAGLIFRDLERGSKVSIAVCNDITKDHWQVKDLSDFSVGSWEPTYDTELWKEKRILNLFVERVEQADSEGRVEIPAQMITVLEWQP